MRVRVLLALVLLAAVLRAVPRGPLGASERSGEVVAFRAPEVGVYHPAAALEEILVQWAETDPERVGLRWLDPGPGAPRVPVLELGASVGERALSGAHGITVVLVGGSDGRSASGSEAVLHAVHGLLGRLDRMPEHVRVVALPRVVPGALDRALGQGRPDGRTGAGRVPGPPGAGPEDAGDDLDGDGMVLDMLVEDPDGPWCLAADGRTLVEAGPADAPRYVRVREGRDDDGDGSFNEDADPGVDFDHQFPVGWPGPGERAGQRPVEDATARAVAACLAELAPDLALLFEGEHGGVRAHERPGAKARDLDLQRRLAVAYDRITGRQSALDPAQLDAVDGDLGDWLAGALGVPTVEVAVWGPRAVGLDGRPMGPGLTAPAGSGAPGIHGPFDARRLAPAHERAWSRWLDEVRGGAGFVAWHPVDLGGGRSALVGGWEPRTRSNPPEDQLASALEGSARFVEELLVALPRLEIEVVEAEREGELVRLSARVLNRGALPTSVFDGLRMEEGLSLGIGSACDVSLLAGPPRVDLDQGLLAQGASAVHTWLFRLEPGATLVLEVQGPCGLRATREVRR